MINYLTFRLFFSFSFSPSLNFLFFSFSYLPFPSFSFFPSLASSYLSPLFLPSPSFCFLISCRDSSDGEGGDDSGTDDDADEDEEEKKKWVPEWAKGPLLKEALERVSSPSLPFLLFSLSLSSFSCYLLLLFLFTCLLISFLHLHSSNSISSYPISSPLLCTNHTPTLPPPLPLNSQQYGLNGHTAMDPDSIFHEVQTCSLEEIFGIKEGKSGV